MSKIYMLDFKIILTFKLILYVQFYNMKKIHIFREGY